MYTDKEHVLDAINAICAKSKRTDSTSILEYINKKFATNADEICQYYHTSFLPDQNNIRNKPTSKGNFLFHYKSKQHDHFR